MRRKIGIIVDDQSAQIVDILKAVKDLEFIEIVDSFQKEREALAHIRNNHVDFVILDMELEQMNGFRFIAQVPRPGIRFVICTAHAKYEDQAYDRQLTDFVRKPVSESRMLAAMRRMNDDLNNKSGYAEQTLEYAEEVFMIKGPAKAQRRLVQLKKLIYVQNLKGKMCFHIVGEEKAWECSESMAEVLKVLPKKWFVQCQQSFILNKAFFVTYVKNEVHMAPRGVILPVGDKNIYTEFFEFLDTNLVGREAS